MPVQGEDNVDYEAKYKNLKRKLKLLINENECFQEELQKAQRALLRAKRDKSFLLDRLLQYQKGQDVSSDSEQTDDSDKNSEIKVELKRKRFSTDVTSSGSARPAAKRKRTDNRNKSGNADNKQIRGSPLTAVAGSSRAGGIVNRRIVDGSGTTHSGTSSHVSSLNSTTRVDGHLSREEIERRLAARQTMNDFSTTISLTLPNQLFSDNVLEGEYLDDDADTSPSNNEEEVTVDSYD